jgi:hypothetical protein
VESQWVKSVLQRGKKRSERNERKKKGGRVEGRTGKQREKKSVCLGRSGNNGARQVRGHLASLEIVRERAAATSSETPAALLGRSEREREREREQLSKAIERNRLRSLLYTPSFQLRGIRRKNMYTISGSRDP